MLPDILKVPFLITVTICALAFQQHPATAQMSSGKPTPCGSYKDEETGMLKDITEDGGRVISGQYSTRCASYYAPYAIMAAAVYAPISAELEKNRLAGRNRVPDADVAVKVLEPEIRLYGRKLLRGWRYQFGSEGYTGCLHDRDTAYPEDDDCKRLLPGRIRRFVGSYTSFAFNVWTNRRRRASCSEVSIVFRGTASLGDYISNGYRYTGWAADTGYHQLERNIDAIIGRIARQKCYTSATQIVSVGHSFGAGLAELAAFAPRTGGPRIAKVFAFNPSSESGYKLVDQNRLASNVGSAEEQKSSLEIDYVYHPGEILEQERVWVPQYPIKQRCFPLVRIVRFDVSKDRGFIPQHNIGNFANGIVKTSINARTLSAPPSVNGCDTRYRRPEGEGEVVAPAPDQAIYARSDPFASTAGTNRYAFASAYAAEAGLKRKSVQQATGPAALRRKFDGTRTIGRKFAMTGHDS